LSANGHLENYFFADDAVEDFLLPLYYDAGGRALGLTVKAGRTLGSPGRRGENTGAENGIPSATLKGSPAPIPDPIQVAIRRGELEARNDRAKAQRIALEEQVAAHGGFEQWWGNYMPLRAAAVEKLNAWTTQRDTLQVQPKRPGTAGVRGDDGFIFIELEESLPEAPGMPNSVRGSAGIEHVLAVISDLERQLRARGIDLIVLVIPLRVEVFPEKLFDLDEMAMDSPVTPYIMARLAEAGMEVVDLLTLYRGLRDKGRDTTFFHPRDYHWDPEGIEVAARELARRLADYAFEESLSQPLEVIRTQLTEPTGLLQYVLDNSAEPAPAMT